MASKLCAFKTSAEMLSESSLLERKLISSLPLANKEGEESEGSPWNNAENQRITMRTV